MRGEHWLLLAGLLGIIGGFESEVQAWGDLLNVKLVLKAAAASGLLIRAAYVPSRTEKP
jgi:hypothetical protein